VSQMTNVTASNKTQNNAPAHGHNCFGDGSREPPPPSDEKEPWVSPFDNALRKSTPTIPRARKNSKTCSRLPRALSAPTSPTMRSGNSTPARPGSHSPSPNQKPSGTRLTCWGSCMGSRKRTQKAHPKLPIDYAPDTIPRKHTPPDYSSPTCSRSAELQSPTEKKKIPRLGILLIYPPISSCLHVCNSKQS
jgi:hypothetical protein